MRYSGTAALTLIFGWGAVSVLAGLVWLLPQLPGALWPVPLVLAAIPLAIYMAEWRLVKRRALLGELTEASGRLRRLLWRGRLLQVGAVLAGVAAVTALYLSASFLQWQHWAVLTVHVAVLAVATGPLRDVLGGQVSGARLGLIVRHGPLLWGGALVLGAAFIGLDVMLEHPDLRGASFANVLETAYLEGADGVRSASLATLLGMTSAGRAGLWYWAQIVGPQLDAAAWMFWLVFVGLVGGIASLMNAYVLAAVGLAERLERRAWKAQPPFHIGLAAAVAVVAAFYAFASHQLADQSTRIVMLPEDRIVSYLDPCRSDRTLNRVEALTGDFAAFANEESARTAGEIAAAVDGEFAALERAVDAYLDWHFSLAGEYSRLWYAVAGDAAAYMDGRFEAMVLAEGAFGERFASKLEAIESRSDGRMRATASLYAQDLSRALADNRCLAKAAPAVAQQGADGGLRHVGGAAAGSLSGAAAAIMVATRLGPRFAARPAARGLVGPVARVFGKTAGKRAASAGGAATAATMLCSPSGPGAILCGAVAGVGTWLAVDVAVLEVDEYMNREAMRARLMAGLDRQGLLATLETANAARIGSAAAEISARRDRVFSVLRDGLGE